MPQSLLHVQHTSSNNAFIKAVRYNDNTGTVIGNHNRDIHIGPVFEEGNGITTKTEGIHIRSNGRVGIGTVLPLEMLDVRGSITADGYVYAASAQFDRGYNYNPALQLGTSTTYLDEELYSLRWGGHTSMGMVLHSSTQGTFGKQGLAIHIPNNQEFGVKTNGVGRKPPKGQGSAPRPRLA